MRCSWVFIGKKLMLRNWDWKKNGTLEQGLQRGMYTPQTVPKTLHWGAWKKYQNFYLYLFFIWKKKINVTNFCMNWHWHPYSVCMSDSHVQLARCPERSVGTPQCRGVIVVSSLVHLLSAYCDALQFACTQLSSFTGYII